MAVGAQHLVEGGLGLNLLGEALVSIMLGIQHQLLASSRGGPIHGRV